MYTWNNIAMIEDDTHFTPWVKSAGRLDHHQGFLKTLEPFLKGNVIDIGANIGTHSIFYAARASKLYCFEPNPLAFECLQHNLKDTSAELFNIALAKDYGTIDLISQNQNYGSAFTQPGDSIECRPLDFLLDTLTSCSFIKLDAEGDELSILQGGSSVIRKFRPVICIEINEHSLYRKGLTGNDVLKYLDEELHYDISKTFKVRKHLPICNDFILHPKP